ncbi:MAG TPA: glycosyltransferase family 39 protein [Bacteroidia bacterium]|nr:glycosyltransferase family 39 protein [Bacteroidia bacterium]
MANKKSVQKPVSQKPKVTQAAPSTPVVSVFPFTFNVKLIILAVLSFILYADTFGNEYCLDDGIVIEKNMYVQNGFGGIGKIMTTDAYDSYYKEMNAGQQLSGGRYRPLSEVIFAIEHAIFGESSTNSIAAQRHIFSVICYILAVIAIFYFLSKYLLKKFKYGEDMAFFAAVLFAIHPMHTEVVANVKSLDEILSILFVCLTFIFSLRYIDSKQPKDLIIGLISFFLSLLAKEYAIMLVMLIPMLFYLLRNKSIGEIITGSLAYWGVFIVYMMLRYKAVGFNGHVATNEILDNPYLLATHTQKIATEIFVLGKYLWMLIVPYPLVSDYSYDMIPYQNFTDISVIATILFYLAFGCWGVWLLIKRNVLAFAVFFYLLCLALVSNLVMDIGATMGERLIFHSSLGFVILVSYGIFELVKKWDISMKRNFLFAVTSVLVIVCGYETMARNLKWKNDITLFTHDVTVGTNSIMLNGNAGARFIDMAQHSTDSLKKKGKLDTAIVYLRKSIYLHKRTPYVSSYLNLGDAFYELQMPDSAEVYWKIVRVAYPDYPDLQKYFMLLGRLYLSKGSQLGGKHEFAAATQEIYKGIRINPTDAELWYNLGGAYYTWGKYDSAYYAWNKTLQINPNHAEAKKGLSVLVPVNKK